MVRVVFKAELLMDQKKRIAFIRPRAWPLANLTVEGVLRDQFPDHGVDVIDVSTLVRNRLGLVLINSLATALFYGKDILRRRKKFRLAFWRTPYIFHQIKRLVQEKIAGGGYSFSFQMQSLFDASTPGLPHFVYTDHTHLENRHYSAYLSEGMYPRNWIALEREIYQNSVLTFVRSSNVKKSVIEEYGCPEEKVRLVYAGGNASVSSTKSVNTDYTKPAILFVGLDWKRKAGADLVKAFQIVRETIPTAKLTIVGATPDIHIQNCEVVGKIPPQELDRYYQEASVFCLPTLREPFGVVFIEAMTARLPIVATRVGAILDFVEEGQNGWLVEPGDTQGLAKALLKLLENPQMCKEFGDHGFKLTRERYSWKAVGKKLKWHISNLLEERENTGHVLVMEE